MPSNGDKIRGASAKSMIKPPPCDCHSEAFKYSSPTDRGDPKASLVLVDMFGEIGTGSIAFNHVLRDQQRKGKSTATYLIENDDGSPDK